MRLLLCLQGLTLLQPLLGVSSSTIPAHAPAIPPQLSATPRYESTSLLPPTKRAWPDHHHNFFVITSVLGLDWLIRFNVLEFIPRGVGSAPASDLVRFYTATLAVARNVWAHDEPRTVRRAAINGVLLTFWADQPIAWDFLHSFLEHIIDRTNGGLIGGFQVTCVAEISGAVVNVALSLPNGRAARAAKREEI
ncbi:MAG: hypothetical protein Q9216_001971 [Gyalolechia sp. 2 TL-2023]